MSNEPSKLTPNTNDFARGDPQSEARRDGTMDQSPSDQERSRQLSRSAGPPSQVEGYDIEHCLGAGAFGSVWLATQRSTGKRVAIKFYEHRGSLDWALLNREVEKLAFLYTDRDVVQLIDVGWDATPPYYVMEYLERGSLEKLLKRGPLAARDAVRIVREVAQALVHAHGRGILHCDLKPANVLLDNDWKTRLADFGQSRLSYEQTPALGTLFYMAPEQADLKAVPDARWDVYALGALLHHLLTGAPPFRTRELEDRLHNTADLSTRLERYRLAIATAPKPTAHRAVRGVDRSLAEIVDRCLAVDPARRFPNGQAVLDALDRRASQRARRPLIALGLVAPIVLLAATIVQGVIGWRYAVRRSEASLLHAVQAGNLYAAQGLAGTVQLQLSKLSDAVDRVARSDDLRARIQEPDETQRSEAVQELVEQVYAFYADRKNWPTSNGTEPPFASWVIFDRDGTLLARSPISDVVGRNYTWRDYFQGGLKMTSQGPNDSVYISRVFQSESDRRYRCGLSAPVRAGADPSSPIIGLVVATIATVSLPFEGERHVSVLLGHWDSNRKPGAAANEPESIEEIIVRHPKHQPGDDLVPVANPLLAKIRAARAAGRALDATDATDDHYRDPLGDQFPEFAGRWLAGFAPVGKSEFVVIVQRRYDEAIGPVNHLARTLAWRGWTALSVGVVLLGGLWYYVQRAMHIDHRVEPMPDGHPPTVDEQSSTELMTWPPREADDATERGTT